MNYMAMIENSCVDFYGWSTVLQVAGCSFNCTGCFNLQAQRVNSGVVFDQLAKEGLFVALSKGHIDNLVLQGGDPLHKRNVETVISLCKEVKFTFPDKNIVLFTGYTFEQIEDDLLRKDVLNYVDFVMDGKYDHTQTNKLPFRGSDNQALWKRVGDTWGIEG